MLPKVSAFLVLASSIFAQAPAFTGFTPGNLVVSRSVYTGDASTVMVGQKLPPLCPATAACGTGTATDNGAYPNVFNNAKPDGSFGVTSPIYLDQLTPAGTVVSTFAVPANLLSTSFPSKSEMGLNVSADGTVITFMAYTAPPNLLDVSNSNTPGSYDPTNPVGSSYFRAVAEVSADGAIRITPTNSYSGNNGRAAILANGFYYMVGNSNNGAGTPANIVAGAGAQIAVPGQSPNTPPMPIGSFSIASLTDPATNMPYAADKLGKDNNFRGLTIFNNTMYVAKGSGGNGVNTVYQVGAAGTLPTPANAATAPITILPGFPVTLAKNADASNPFGLFFANATTLYVADEGTGAAADAATSTNAGLQKWTLVSGTWKRLYVLRNGLNLGQAYSVPNYPAAFNPATDGLRNLAGRVNQDGTVTVYAVTSTISASGDQGADPNKLVSITDIIANTDPAAAANLQFTTLRSAAAGEVLRGVALAPTTARPNSVSGINVYSAAANSVALAPGSLATIYGQNLAVGSPVTTTLPLPTSSGATMVNLVDATGKTTLAPLLYVSASQINFQVPAGIAPGTVTVQAINGAVTQSATNIQIAAAAPSLFTLNTSGLAAATTVSVNAAGVQTPGVVTSPISLGGATDTVYLSLYGTGLQSAATAGVKVSINGVDAPVTFAGSQQTFPGLDQVNVRIPSSLAGKGQVTIQVTAGGLLANPVQVTIQ